MLSTEDFLAAKILVVDDSPDNVDLLVLLLNHEGYCNVTATTSPLDVLPLHQLNRFDLIVLDIQMPDMNGFQVMESLRNVEPDGWLPVLVITAQPSYKLRALDSGAKDFLSKPFEYEELTRRVRNLLEMRLLYNRATLATEELHRLALHDPLTGLPNRRLLDDRIFTAIEHAKRNRSHVAMMYIDLDGFKAVNDTLGHDSGDKLLQAVADRLVSVARREDTVARIGGDEFILILGELDKPENIHVPAAKIIQAIAQPYALDDDTVTVTTSIGISVLPFDTASLDALLTQSDKALYQAKRQGKNQYHLITDESEKPSGQALLPQCANDPSIK